MKIDPVSILLSENFRIDKKIYFISGNEKTLIELLTEALADDILEELHVKINDL